MVRLEMKLGRTKSFRPPKLFRLLTIIFTYYVDVVLWISAIEILDETTARVSGARIIFRLPWK